MPFDAVSLEFTLFLGLLTIPASLHTDPYFRPWQGSQTSDGAYRDPRRPPLPERIEPRTGGRVFSEFEGRNSGPEIPPDVLPRQKWHLLRRDHRHSDFGAQGSAPLHRSSESVWGAENPGVQNTRNYYSSQVENQKNKNIRENIEPIFGPEGPGRSDEERRNFEEGSRSLRTGDPKEVDVPYPRIVTPKGGRRPSQGSSVKNQNGPFGAGGTNAISTTQKTFRNQTSKESRKPQRGDIVFPDASGDSKKFVPGFLKCARQSTYCEHVGDQYPADHISRVLKKEGATFREFFGRDVISDPNITERINAAEENSLCPYRQEVVFPKAAQNKEDKWLFIINQDQYVQGVTVEVCLTKEDQKCMLTDGFPLGYTPYCKQKYIERRLVAIGEDGKPHSDFFRLPSCCSCVVRHEPSARTGTFRSGPPSQ